MKRMLIVAALAGCNTVPPNWAGVPMRRVVVEGTVWDVRHQGTYAMAFRQGSQWAPNLRSVMGSAEQAIERATNCAVLPGSFGGDQVFVTAQVLC